MIIRYKDFIYESTLAGKSYRSKEVLEVKELLRKYRITDYILNPETNLIDVFENIYLNNKDLTSLPEIRFGKIYGDFDCRYNKLTSLLNCPNEVDGSFECESNFLTSLEFSPKIINGSFKCSNNRLTSLKFCPKEINGDFLLQTNQLTSLEYCPEIVNGSFNCSHNQLTSLRYCPEIVTKFVNYNPNFNCMNNKLTSLDFCPKNNIGNFLCGNNLLTSIEDYPMCIIKGIISHEKMELLTNFRKIQNIVKENEEIFIHLLDNKIKFHQMVMRLDPSMIQYYKNIPPPSKNSNLLV